MPTREQIEAARNAPVKLTKRQAEVLRMFTKDVIRRPRESRDIAMAAKLCGWGLLFGIGFGNGPMAWKLTDKGEASLTAHDDERQ